MPNQPKTPAHTIRFDDEDWTKVTAKAKATGVSASDVVRAAVKKDVEGKS